MTPSSPATLQHPQLGPVLYRVDVVSDDPDTQVAQVIGIMSRYAAEDSRSAPLIKDAATVREWMRQAAVSDVTQGVYSHIRAKMTFVRDESTASPLQPNYRDPIVECLTRPRDLAIGRFPQGDCDDFAMYGASLLLALGVPVSFVTVAAEPNQPGIYSHVYLAAYPNGQRVPLDLSHGPGPNWETPYYTRRTEWPVNRQPSIVCCLAILGGLGLALTLYKRRN